MELICTVCNLICGLLLLLSISPLEGLKTTTITREEIKMITDFSATQLSAISHKISQRLARWYDSNQKVNAFSSRNKRATPIDEIKCNQESLEALLEICESAAAASVDTLYSARSRKTRNADSVSFCGPSCSNLVFTYVNVCGLQEFIVNVSGACKLDGKKFSVHCIHAVVVVKPGIVSCTKTLQESVTHDIQHLEDPSKSYRESQCCSLQTYHNSTLPGHDIIFDRNIQKFRVEPPLVPPWKNINVSEYPPVTEVTSSQLCVEETTMATDSIHAATTTELITMGNQNSLTPSGTHGTIFKSDFVFHSFVVLILCFYFVLVLSAQIST